MKKQLKALRNVFYGLSGSFFVLLAFILAPTFELREISPFMSQFVMLIFWAVMIAVFVLSVILIVMTFKTKRKNAQKTFLLLTGFAPFTFVVSVVLHNVFYALGVMFAESAISAVWSFFDVAFFLLAVFGAPIMFFVGIIGSIVHFRKHKK